MMKRIREELEFEHLPPDARIKRTYAGHRMKKRGAFIWMVESKSEFVADIGSSLTVTELLKAPELEVLGYWGDAEIVPKEEK